MTANLLLSRGIVGTTFFSPPALADSDHHRGNAVLFALALMCSRDGRSAFFHSLYNAASRHAQAVALADKIARMAWAIMVRGERYKEPNLLLAA